LRVAQASHLGNC